MKFKPKAITYIGMAGCSENTVDGNHQVKFLPKPVITLYFKQTIVVNTMPIK